MLLDIHFLSENQTDENILISFEVQIYRQHHLKVILNTRMIYFV